MGGVRGVVRGVDMGVIRGGVNVELSGQFTMYLGHVQVVYACTASL